MLSKTEINDGFKKAKEILQPFGGKVEKVTFDYQLFAYEGNDVKLVFYPHKASTGNYHIRVRNQNSKNDRRKEALLEKLSVAGFPVKNNHYWLNSHNRIYSECCNVMAGIIKETNTRVCFWCNRKLDLEGKVLSEENNDKAENIICPYCNADAVLEDSSKVYGINYGLLYICRNYPKCDAYVGVHEGTAKPLGRLANKELRLWKNKAHAAFDPLWKRKLQIRRTQRGSAYKKGYARGSGYKWLAEQLGIDKEQCHIGMFDVDTCKKVVEICQPYLKNIKLTEQAHAALSSE